MDSTPYARLTHVHSPSNSRATMALDAEDRAELLVFAAEFKKEAAELRAQLTLPTSAGQSTHEATHARAVQLELLAGRWEDLANKPTEEPP